MITIATCLWEANDLSQHFSRAYTTEWAARLFRGFDRNLTVPHRNVLFTDRRRDLPDSVEQIVQPDLGSNGYGDCIRPFSLNEAMIFAGLDTIVIASIDHLADWCMKSDKIALPNPYGKLSCNGVVLCPAGQGRIFQDWRGENDMDWLREQPHYTIDVLFPGEVVSFKAHVRGKGLGKARIVYFHGVPKMSDLVAEPWVRQYWQ